ADGRELVVVRTAAGDAGAPEAWEVTSPEKGPAKKWKVSSLLWTLGSLKSAAVVDDKQAKDLGRLGLDARARQGALFDAGNRELARLALGREAPGRPGTLYAKGSRGQVVELDGSRLSDLPTSPADLVDRAGADAGTPTPGPLAP